MEIKYDTTLKAAAVALAAILAFMAVSSQRMLADVRDYLIADAENRLMNLKEVTATELEAGFRAAMLDPSQLRTIKERESVYRVALLDVKGFTVADSGRAIPMAPVREGLDITPKEFEEVKAGRSLVAPIVRRDGLALRSVYFPLIAPGGRLDGVGVLTMDVGYIEDLTDLGTTHFLLKSLSLMFVILALMYVIRRLMASQKKMVQAVRSADVSSLGPAGTTDDVSFVIGSFQAVVKDLKEKEAELRRLKDEAEGRARSIESYNENVLKNIQTGVVTVDAGGGVITANSAAVEILGLAGTGAGTDGKKLDDLITDGRLSGAVNETLAGGAPVKRNEGSFRLPGGTLKWLGFGTSPLFGEDGRIEGAILVFSDLTEVRELRERMELKERMSLLGEMSAGLAHELRNPMAVVSGYSKLLAGRLKDGADDETLGAIADIQSEIDGMDELIREFMAFAQPNEPKTDRVPLGAVLDESLKTMEGLRGGVDVTLGGMDGLPPAVGDGILIRQVFINIVKNAYEAMPDGGILEITARTEDVAAEPEFNQRGGEFVRIDFLDTGPGIPDGTAGKVFTPFFTTKPEGTGLGLALVQKIVTHHGGWCTVENGPNKGALVSVHLPAAA